MSLEPGRELDELVAMKVMGWEFVPDAKGDYDSVQWEFPGGKTNYLDAKEMSPFPSYSTDMRDAWEVVLKVSGPKFSFSLVRPLETAWHATFVPVLHGDVATEKAQTAPHAICLAALGAMKTLGSLSSKEEV